MAKLWWNITSRSLPTTTTTTTITEWNGMEWNGMEWNGMEWSTIMDIWIRTEKSPFAIKTTMTTSLDDNGFDCTEPSGLERLQPLVADGLITTVLIILLDGVIEGAISRISIAYLKSLSSQKRASMAHCIGIQQCFYSTARVLDRFGLLVLVTGKMEW